MKIFSLFILIVTVWSCHGEMKEILVTSPDSKIKVIVECGEKQVFSVKYKDTLLIKPSEISLHLSEDIIIGRNNVIKDTLRRQVNDTIRPVIKEKHAVIVNNYNELVLKLSNGFEVQFRAYNDGIAYRFVCTKRDSLVVMNEEATFLLNPGSTVIYPQVTKRNDADIFHSSFEEPYLRRPVDSLPMNMFAYTPVLIESTALPKILITESDVTDYPGMFLTRAWKGGLKAGFAGYPLDETIAGGEFKQKIVTRRAPYICRTRGPRNFPWRVISIAPTDADLLLNDLVYRLASPPEFEDLSWIKPGISTEEWITGLNLYGVDFRAGLNTTTYKYYIDFAQRFGFRYVMLDAGWSDPGDLFKITPAMDMEEITLYAKEKGIGLILWTEAMTMERQMKEALKQFKKWDIKIVMTDFIDRNDQKAINFLHHFSRECADNGFMCMIHGAPVPAGFSRTWPNMLAREGVLGSEYNIWSSKANPEHDLQLPFIRMVAGPMDYEPGLLQNAGREQSSKLGFEKVIAQGTRIHQIAMFVIYESPLQLFSGNLSDAAREPELMEFLGRIPTVWDETRIADARFGDYIIEARRNGTTWYIAAMNDWAPKKFTILLDFLPPGKFKVEVAHDGINADRNPQDYGILSTTVVSGDSLSIDLAPGGGYVAIITPVTLSP